MAKDSIFSRKQFMNCRGDLHTFDGPMVMGILNVTPDSFYDGGKFDTSENLLKQAEKLLNEGADIIDVGGYSSRPSATDIPEKEELNRVIPAIELLVNHFPEIIISIDTFRSTVAEQAVAVGASIINDISAGEMDNKMFPVVAKLNVPYILMHMLGTPQNMQKSPRYTSVLNDVIKFLSARLNKLNELGVNDVIIDSGFGFGKSLEHNYQLLAGLEEFRIFNKPVMVGFSRKSMVNKVIASKAENALNGTTVLNTIALTKGAEILRVHDVKAAKEAVKIVNYLQKN